MSFGLVSPGTVHTKHEGSGLFAAEERWTLRHSLMSLSTYGIPFGPSQNRVLWSRINACRARRLVTSTVLGSLATVSASPDGGRVDAKNYPLSRELVIVTRLVMPSFHGCPS